MHEVHFKKASTFIFPVLNEKISLYIPKWVFVVFGLCAHVWTSLMPSDTSRPLARKHNCAC